MRFGRASTISAFPGAPRRALAAAEHETLDHLRRSLILQRRGDMASDSEDLGRRGWHRDPMADGPDHLEVVVLVADRHRLLERHAKSASEPADGPTL